MKIQNRKRFVEWSLWGVGISLALITMAIALHPDLRSGAHSYLQPNFRKVISTAVGDLLGDGNSFKVVKVKTELGLSIEIYGAPTEQGLAPLIEKVELNEMKDAYFNYHGEATQLALQDVDGDSSIEILVPSFDRDLVAHLSVFRLQPESHKLEIVSN